MSNILQLTILRYPEIRGGVDTMVVNLVDQLRIRHKVCVFIPGDWEQTKLSRRNVNGISVYSLRLRMPVDDRRPIIAFLGWLLEFPGTIHKLYNLIKTEDIDLIHAHVGKDYQMYLRVLHWIGGPPYVITLHRGDIVEYPNLHMISRALMRFALRGAESVNAVSRWLAKEAEITIPGIAPVAHVYNGIELPEFEEVDDNMDKQGYLPLPDRFAIMIGSFDAYKGHDTALQAWGLISTKEPDLHLILLGDGELRSMYESLIDSVGCTGCIHMPGQLPRKDVIRILKRALFMIFPSRSEGFAYALLEAGLIGTPVVCTQIEAFTEIIEDGVSGLVVPVDDPQSLADAVIKLSTDQVLRKQLGRTLSGIIRDKFTSANMAKEYENIYSKTLANQ